MRDVISSTSNPRVKAIAALRSRRERDRTGRFLIEGATELARAATAGVAIEEIYIREGEAAPSGFEGGTVSVVELAPAAFARAALREGSGGVIAVARSFPTPLPDLSGIAGPLVLVVESIEKPGNLGAVLRTGVAAGADAVVVCDPVVDVFNPNVVRASLGALFMVPVAVTTTGDALAWMEAGGVRWTASSAHGTRPHWEADLTGPSAVVVGAEHRGLSDPWLADPSRVVTIPTPGPVGSLNTAMVAGLLLFEAVRQRTAG